MAGDTMAVGPHNNRSWIRENRYEYEIDLTLDSGAVTTIAQPDSILEYNPGKPKHREEKSNIEWQIELLYRIWAN